jgi:hypothetical protein
MKLLTAAVLITAIWLLVGAAAPAAATAQASAAPQCSPAPANCTGWYTTDVSLSWSIDADDSNNCDNITFRQEGVHSRTCRVRNGADPWTSVPVVVRIDKTAPRVAAITADRPPDANGWYRRAVAVRYVGADDTSGIASCTTWTYSGPDVQSTTASGRCWDKAGHASSVVPYTVRYDATAPTILTVAPARRADHAGWYTRPVGFSVVGADTTSGLAGCDPVEYRGPDAAGAVINGVCRDQAGNVASRAFTIPFDATPPALRRVRVAPGDRVVRLNWSALEHAKVEVSRSPGRRGDPRTVLYRGAETSLVDRKVRNGRRYLYSFTAIDPAGNRARRTFAVVPGPRLVSPAAGARVSAPLVLRWTPVRGAQYYNVQLWRDGRKVLSAWPTRARFELPRSWRYLGERRRLVPGRYRWLVWPGEGPRSLDAYGPLIGRRSFVFKP